MVEKDKIQIYIKQAIINLFVFKKKPNISMSTEEWDVKTHPEQIQEFKDMLEYDEHKWLKYFFLKDIIRWIIYTSPFWLILIFGLTINCLIYGIIINLCLITLGVILNKKATRYMMEARSDWFFMNEMIKEINR